MNGREHDEFVLDDGRVVTLKEAAEALDEASFLRRRNYALTKKLSALRDLIKVHEATSLELSRRLSRDMSELQ